MSKNRTHGGIRGRLRRGICGVLCLALLLGLLPAAAMPAQAAASRQSWAMPYMEQLVDWGVMRGDVGGNLAPERNITRAEFVTLVNRAYGYTRTGGTPFTDVRSGDWYAQDIDIAYNMGYFKGTSPTTASPLAPVTREQAAVLLTRNLMLQETVGETLGFSDSRTLAEWSRGLIGAAAANGVINGYADGSFRPRNNISRGEVAAMLVRSIGTPISEAGDYDLGSVYGNVTVSSSGVNLRNSVITGNLLLTGGVDLGEVLLENVTVLGQIIVSGAGESNSSQSSVLLRNVEADEMVVDSISNQFVTIRAEGNTSIGTTKVRTNAYVDDSSLPGFGLSYIELDGDNGSLLQLAGNVKEVVNKTPSSNLQIVQGSADKVTVDEKAVGSNVLVDTGTRVGELNLDVGANVTGDGDIKDLNVGAAGSTVTELPDSIYIRPGINADINGSNMNSTQAAESSADPRLLAGYPKVKEVAPTSATAVFSTNKAGTVYWALSAVADGSVGEEDLISPPVYGGKAVKSGNLKATASKTEYTAKLSGLTTDGSYYLSAMLVDDRGNHSPVKVTAFTTPDSTVPAFTSGYPRITRDTTEAGTAQVTAMTNKDCLLYYALLPSGSTAPKAQDFKSAAINGNLGYGSVDMVKNVTQPINVNSVTLDEQTKYDLYLWLTDYNGAKSSAVKKLTFTTRDETPPVITYLEQDLGRTTATAVGVTYSLDEPGTLYWAIYPDDGSNPFVLEFGDDETSDKWKDVKAKAFVKSGLSATKKGKSNASKAATEISYAISGLNSKTTGTTSYMLYVVAEDKAGNLCAKVEARNVRTLDDIPPKVHQEFTDVDTENPNEATADTDIRLVFDERVQGDPIKEEEFKALYDKVTQTTGAEQDAARDALATALKNHIKMWQVAANGREELAKIRPDDLKDGNTEWVVDYRYATVTMEDGNMVVTLPTTKDDNSDGLGPSALNLKSGATYFFVLSGIYDMALKPNPLNKKNPLRLDNFRIVFAHVSVNRSQSVAINAASGLPAGHVAPPFDIDFNFTVEPEAVDAVQEAMMWDMLIWSDRTMDYELYSRPKPAEGALDDGLGWVYEGSASVIASGLEDGFVYSSFHRVIKNQRTFPQLVTMGSVHGDREYAIRVTNVGSSNVDGINVKISIEAGYHTGLTNVADGSRKSHLDAAKTTDGVATISRPEQRLLYKELRDSTPPKFNDNYPVIRAGDISASIDVMLDKAGYVYWVAVPMDSVTAPTLDNSLPMKGQEDKITEYNNRVPPTALGLGKNWSDSGKIVDAAGSANAPLTASGKPVLSTIPTQGPTADKNNKDVITNDHRYYLAAPDRATVVALAQEGNSGTRRGGVTERLRPNIAGDTITLSDLQPDTVYLLYVVTANTSDSYEANAEVYRFTTEKAVRPGIDAEIFGTSVKISIYQTPTANLDYMLVLRGNEPEGFSDLFTKHVAASDVNTVTGLYGADFTVLDAMCRPVTSGGDYQGTVFDEYATTAAKNTFASRIRNSQPSSTIVMKSPSGNNTFTQANNTVQGKNMVKCTGMVGINNYTFIAVGKSTMGSGDAFRAIYSVHNDDNEQPKVDVNFSSIEVLEWDTTDPNAVKIKDGIITLAFSEDLYARPSADKKPIPVDNCKLAATGHANTTYAAIGGLVTSGGAIQVIGDDKHDKDVVEATAPISTVKLSVSGAGNGYTINFRNTLCDENGNGVGNTLSMKIIITKSGTGDNATYTATLDVPREWKK